MLAADNDRTDTVTPGNGAETGAPPLRVILAEDAVLLRAGLAELLERFGFQVTAVPDGATLKDTVRKDTPDLVITDVRMPPAFALSGRARPRRSWRRSSPACVCHRRRPARGSHHRAARPGHEACALAVASVTSRGVGLGAGGAGGAGGVDGLAMTQVGALVMDRPTCMYTRSPRCAKPEHLSKVDILPRSRRVDTRDPLPIFPEFVCRSPS
ncbi:response regulator [Embleya sp. NBC_00896]|uniref:response regulator n=1 Tax=Embleya sp. NBC_00896 TaxID=2975961 RepID=UPI00386D379E